MEQVNVGIYLHAPGRACRDKFDFGDDATIGKQLMTIEKEGSNQAFGVFAGKANGKFIVALYDGLSWDLSGKVVEFDTEQELKSFWQLD